MKRTDLKEFAMVIALLMMVACAGVVEDASQPGPAEVWLDKIEAKAGEVQTLSAKVVHVREQGMFKDTQARTGTLVYESGPPAKFRAQFDKLVVDDALHDMRKTYVFDGRYLVERDDDERIWSRWELAREGETVDLLAIGEGPFALPLSMKKDAVLERFDVAVGDKDEDGKLVHLVLTPKKEMDVTRVDLWFDAQTLLPTRARQEEGEDATDVRLRDTVVNPERAVDAFDTSPPSGANWQISDTPLPVEETAEPAPE